MFETRIKSTGQYWLRHCLQSQLKVIIRIIFIIIIVPIPTIIIICITVDVDHFVLRAVGTLWQLEPQGSLTQRKLPCLLTNKMHKRYCLAIFPPLFYFFIKSLWILWITIVYY